MVTSAYSKGQRASEQDIKAAQDFPGAENDIADAMFSGNSAELELLRQELRGRSNSLRNTSVRQTREEKLPGSENTERSFTAKIESRQETIYLGADKEEEKVIAAANLRGQEALHSDENCEYSSESSRCTVETVQPMKRDDFTLSGSNLSDYGFISTAAKDEKLERQGNGQIRRAAEMISTDNDEQTADEIKELKGLDSDESSELSGLDDLAQSVEQRSRALSVQAEQQTRRILNTISVQQPSGDDFFDFLRRRSDEEQPAANSEYNDTETEGMTYEEDH